MDAWREAVIAEAKTWLGTKWHHEARVKGSGVDCGQFILAAFEGAGLVPHIETGHYPADWMLHREEERYLAFVETHLDRVETPKPADVAVWQFGKCFSHGAIVVDWPVVIHAFRPERAVVWGDATKGQLARMHLPEGGSAPRPVRFYSIERRL